MFSVPGQCISATSQVAVQAGDLLLWAARAQTSELYQWNAEQAGLPLEWPAAAQLGGVIALSQRAGRSDIVIGGFAGCAQVLAY